MMTFSLYVPGPTMMRSPGGRGVDGVLDRIGRATPPETYNEQVPPTCSVIPMGLVILVIAADDEGELARRIAWQEPRRLMTPSAQVTLASGRAAPPGLR